MTCRCLLWTFAALYALALLLFAIGVLGLFGQARDPLSAIPLVVLGLPWNQLSDTAPERWLPWLAVAAPSLNLLAIAAIGRVSRGGRPGFVKR